MLWGRSGKEVVGIPRVCACTLLASGAIKFTGAPCAWVWSWRNCMCAGLFNAQNVAFACQAKRVE